MPELLSPPQMARRAHVTQQWLREQAEAGGVPCLKAGRRFLFSPSAVMNTLTLRASQGAGQEGGADRAHLSR